MAHEGDPVVSGDGVGERLVFTLLCPVEFLVHVYVFCSRIGTTFNATHDNHFLIMFNVAVCTMHLIMISLSLITNNKHLMFYDS